MEEPAARPAAVPTPHDALPGRSDGFVAEQALRHRAVSWPALAGFILLGTLLAGVLWPQQSAASLLTWWTLLLTTLALRAGLAQRSVAGDALRRVRTYRAADALHGLTWGLASAGLLQTQGAAEQELLTLVVVLAAAGGWFAFIFDRASTLLFVVPALLPQMTLMALRGSALGAASAAVIGGFMVLAGLSARRAEQRIAENLALRQREALRTDAVRHSERLLSRAEQVAGLGSFEWDLASGELRWSDEHYRLWGLDPGLGEPSFELFQRAVHPDDREHLQQQLAAALDGGRVYDCRHRVRWPDGSVHTIHGRGEVYTNAAGKAVTMIGTVQDITAQEADRAALATTLEHLRRTLNATGDAMFAYDLADADGRLLFANDQFFEMFRIPAEDVAGTGRAEIITAARRLFVDPDAEVRRIEAIIRMAEPHEDRVPLRDGRVLWRRSVPMRGGGHAARVWSFRDITTEERAVQALRAAEAEQRALLAAFPGFIAAIDPALRYAYVNERMAELLGGTPAQIVGRSLREVLGDERAAVVEREIEQSHAGAPVVADRRFEATATRPRLDIRLTLVSGQGAGAEHANYYAFGLDITPLKQAKEALQAARDEALAANQAKSQFLSSMSHELRTPLNAILGFGQLLESDTGNALPLQQQRYVREILRGGTHLLELINDVLDLARIEAGRMAISLEPVGLRELLTDCVGLIAPVAAARGIVVEVAPDGRIAVQADRTRLKQVLLNLLANAIKYNRENGSVRLAARLHGESVRVNVTDSGDGLTEAQRQRLFQPFERLDADQAGVAGTGIGLALSRRLIEAMQGEIGVDSEPGAGSTFWVQLPLARADAAPAALPPPPPAPVSAAPHDTPTAHVLYIEDNPVNVVLMEAMLARLPQVRLTSAPLPGVGLDIARAERPDLVLLDIQMPGMDGFEVLRHLCNIPGGQDIPAIAVSANAMAGDIERAREAGFADYLTKPLDIGRLLDAVRAALAGHRRFG